MRSLLVESLAALPCFHGLKRRRRPIRWRDTASLIPLFFPGLAFGSALLWARASHDAFAWLGQAAQWPGELWIIALCGTVATLAGFGDWLFHRLFYSVGGGEQKSHFLAMASGGVPLFLLMLGASVSRRPEAWLIPIIVLALYTTVLICYDEFVFHRRRCRALETALHRVLVFGHTAAWLAWMHWCYA